MGIVESLIFPIDLIIIAMWRERDVDDMGCFKNAWCGHCNTIEHERLGFKYSVENT